MDEVKRWDQQFKYTDSSLRQYDDGRYVFSSDYDALLADNERLAGELAEANRRALESSMLAFKWMAAHDKRAAGEVNYEYPAPADVPTCITERDELRAQVEGLKEALGEIATMPIPGGGLAVDAYMASIARAALAAGPEQRAEQQP